MDYNSAMFNLQHELIKLQGLRIDNLNEKVDKIFLMVVIALVILFINGVVDLWKH